MRKTFAFAMIFLSLSCNSNSSSPNADNGSCNIASIENSLNEALNAQSSSTDFSFQLEKESGRTYTYSRGTSSMNQIYESASTSKWVTAAIILREIDRNVNLNLEDSPNDHYSWAMPSSDPLYNTTLSQLLSFTSGLQEEPACLNLGVPNKTFDECLNDNFGSVTAVNEGNGYTPGAGFYYSSSHLQLAGAMAIAAGSFSDWQALFDNFQSETGLFLNSSYSLPSVSNPRLAGGMTWTGNDYMSFLKAIYNESLLSESSFNAMFSDQIGDTPISYSPANTGLNEQWHYGYGVWLQCPETTFNCSQIDYYSSPGAYGAYPFINFNKKFFGIVARQGSLGTYTEGVQLFRSVQDLAESWADCP